MKRAILILSAVALLSAVADRAEANLVLDGGFELAAPGVYSGPLGDGAWSVTQGTVQVIADPTLANTGVNSLQLTYDISQNAITQTLATQVGQAYQLSFFAASDDGNDPFTVLFGGQVVTTTPVPMTFPALGTAHGTYVLESFFVTATSTSTDLTFQGQYNGPGASYGTFLDDISVNPVPEPCSLALSGIGALFVIGHGLRRRRKPAG